MTETETLVAPTTKARICKTVDCKLPLTYIEESHCWRCLICNPILETKPVEKIKNKYIDVTMTEKIVLEIIEEVWRLVYKAKTREIVQDELANWHIQKPPITRDEITEAVGVAGENTHIEVEIPKPETWMQKAKRLGVRTHNDGTGGMRKKVDIMADMKERETDETVPEEFHTEEQTGSGGGERPSVDTGDAEASE